MTTIEKILQFELSEIEEAATETDTSIIELFADIHRNCGNDRIPANQVCVHTTVWIESSAGAMLEYLEENMPRNPIEDATAEAEYKADWRREEEQIRRLS